MIVAVTGHRDLGDAGAAAWVRQALADQLAARPVTCGLSGLAEGADQLFAELVIDARLELEAVIACAQYEATFSTAPALASYRRLLSCSARVTRLPFDAPSSHAFLAVAEWLVARCDLLLAVWNGEPARGPGGTADVVALARSRHVPWIHLNPVTRTVTIAS